MRRWYVEDAGGGCKAFSEILVLVSEEPEEIYTARVPLTWSDKQSLEEVVCSILIDLMERAKVRKTDFIYVCSGNIFHAYHKWLAENGYIWEYAKMEGLAHEVAEKEFYNQMVAAGFPPHIQLIDRNYRDFYRLVEDWITQEPERQCFVKDRTVRQKPIETRYVLKSNYARTHRCSGCRKEIKPYIPMVEYKARVNGKRQRRYYHPECSPVNPIKCRLTTMEGIWQGDKITGVILPCRTELNCMSCNKPVSNGEAVFYSYVNDLLIHGHKECFEK